MSWRSLLLALFLAAGFMILSADTSEAGPITLGGPWREFAFGGSGSPATGCSPADPLGPACIASSGGNSIYADAPPWTITVPAGGKIVLRVVDAFCKGDRFDVYDSAVLLGITSLVPIGTCFDAGLTSDPAVAWGDPGYSRAKFVLGPGAHSFTMVASTSPFGGGAAYFRVDSAVAEPGSLLLLGTGLLLAGGYRRRMRVTTR